MDFVKKIIEKVKEGHNFDTHHVINCAIKDYSDDYIQFVSQYAGSEQPTFTAHQQFGHQIAKLEGTFVKRQPDQSHSLNIHGNSSECALWKRI